LDRQRVGIPTGEPETRWTVKPAGLFRDWFDHQMAEAYGDQARVEVDDNDGIIQVTLVASNDEGQSWSAYPMVRESPPAGDVWVADAREVSTRPSGGPTEVYEFTILPREPYEHLVLLVDAHGGLAPAEDGVYRFKSERYYQEALVASGYQEWDRFDVRDPMGEGTDADGPVLEGLRWYDTVIWFTGDNDFNTLTLADQQNLVDWLADSEEWLERNLLLTGNDIATEVVGRHDDPLGLYGGWLQAGYFGNLNGNTGVTVHDEEGGFDFLDLAPGFCALPECPFFYEYDVLWHMSPEAEVALVYWDQYEEPHPAAVAYSDPTRGYQTVALGFGLEFMAVAEESTRFEHGGEHRANLMGNIMEYFQIPPEHIPTEVEEEPLRNSLSHAYPNPANPSVTIAFSVKEEGPVAIRVYDVAGRIVRTLVDREFDAGASGRAVWNGCDEAGRACASGVYFSRIDAPGFEAERKLVLVR